MYANRLPSHASSLVTPPSLRSHIRASPNVCRMYWRVNRVLARPPLRCSSSSASAAFLSTNNTMLGRARDRAKCAPAPANMSTSKPDLAKQLFPSSSPSRPESDITSWVTSKKPHASSARTMLPLTPGSGNSGAPSNTRGVSTLSNATARAPMNNSLVSVCSKAGSFDDLPSLDKSQSYGSVVSDVCLNEEDFSDDADLDLEFECSASVPSSLPNPGSKTSGAQSSSAVAATSATAIALTTSQTDWSSSPQHHMIPPEDAQTAKRSSADGSQTPAKKRVLLWKGDEQVKPPVSADNSAGPPWDATASTLQEQSRHHKNQSKKSQPHLSFDEMRDIADDHAMQKKAISLSSEQLHVLDLVVSRHQSVFFTGPAGTGKSVLMRSIISELRKKWIRTPERLSVTASTGLAACNIGGQTLHSFAGIGLGKEDVATLVRKIRRNKKAKDRWLRTSALIIDEISMVDGDLFDKLSQIGRTIRNNGRPFGGIQLIVTGDFFQLPPVPDSGSIAKFAFDAATWNTSIDHTIGLTQIFRQKDPEFAGMLNEMRLGKISDETIKAFRDLARPLTFSDGLEVTQLFPTRLEVEKSNDMRLNNLPGETQRFDAIDAGDPSAREKVLQNMMAPKSLVLKIDAQVMLVKNLDDTLVNGSLGKVIGFMAELPFETWAGTGGPDESKQKSNKDSEGKSTNPVEYPVVRFTATDGSHRIVLCVPETWRVELPTGELQASRTQLPLILAWALSIHKAQGQTLERVKVDLGKVFERGQAYVALSRAVSKQGLQVLRFEKSKIMAHNRVIQFYNNLYSAETAAKAKKTHTVSGLAPARML